MPHPGSAPTIAGGQAIRDGTLWVERWDRAVMMREDESDRTFNDVDAGFRGLGPETVPTSLGEVREIGPDYILTAWMDDLDVQYLRMYRIVKEGG